MQTVVSYCKDEVINEAACFSRPLMSVTGVAMSICKFVHIVLDQRDLNYRNENPEHQEKYPVVSFLKSFVNSYRVEVFICVECKEYFSEHINKAEEKLQTGTYISQFVFSRVIQLVDSPPIPEKIIYSEGYNGKNDHSRQRSFGKHYTTLLNWYINILSYVQRYVNRMKNLPQNYYSRRLKYLTSTGEKMYNYNQSASVRSEWIFGGKARIDT